MTNEDHACLKEYRLKAKFLDDTKQVFIYRCSVCKNLKVIEKER